VGTRRRRAAIPTVEVLRCDAQYSERRRAAKPLLLYVGRLSAEKDIATLREVLRAMPETRLGLSARWSDAARGSNGTSVGRRFILAGYMSGEAWAAA